MFYYKKNPLLNSVFIKNDFFNLKKSISILHISDTHFGKFPDLDFFKHTLKAINDDDSDFIVFNGDIFDKECSKEIFINYLDDIFKLCEKKIIYFVYGNHEMVNIDKEILIKKLIKSPENFVVLDNDFVDSFNILGFNIIGLSNESKFKDKTQLEIFSDMASSHKISENNIPILVLSHNPNIFENIPNIPVIILSGHTHGEQILLFGRKILKDFLYLKGLHKIHEKVMLFISNGAGYGRIPFRLGVRNHIDKITIL